MKKVLFVDRDGTLIKEPEDEQVDSLAKLELVEQVMSALITLGRHGYRFVMITNQDGLGTSSYPQADFDRVQTKILSLFSSQGICFDEVLICPHLPQEGCGCRKPHLALLTHYLKNPAIDWQHSYVIGDRQSDMELARRMGIQGYILKSAKTAGGYDWSEITQFILAKPRRGVVKRVTKETAISVEVRLDEPTPISVQTSYGFFNHMLEQIGCHGEMGLIITAAGDEDVDSHHLIEDTGLALGEAIRQALSDKMNIGRYGFALPMDEAASEILVDLSDRPYFLFDGEALRHHPTVGGIAVEMIEHFFRSFATALKCNLHMKVTGHNGHHMVEALFKGLGRCLKTACDRDSQSSSVAVPSTKGTL